jgi:hypothetical protein
LREDKAVRAKLERAEENGFTRSKQSTKLRSIDITRWSYIWLAQGQEESEE